MFCLKPNCFNPSGTVVGQFEDVLVAILGFNKGPIRSILLRYYGDWTLMGEALEKPCETYDCLHIDTAHM